MRALFFAFPLLALASCSGEPAPLPGGDSGQDVTLSDAPYPDDLQRMLAMMEPYVRPDQPCLARETSPFPEVEAIPKSRWREVQSDSYWLGRWARENLGDRLAYATVTADIENDPGALIYQIGVTGSEPVDPPPLGDRARDVPVRVMYDFPISEAEFMARRDAGREKVAALVPEWTGEGGAIGPHGFVHVDLMVYSEDGNPDPGVLAQCDALRRAYRLPVLFEFVRGRMTLD